MLYLREDISDWLSEVNTIESKAYAPGESPLLLEHRPNSDLAGNSSSPEAFKIRTSPNDDQKIYHNAD
jgi:hypothetical protein